MAPPTNRPGMMVQLYLPGMHHSLFHMTTKCVEWDSLKKAFHNVYLASHVSLGLGMEVFK
jgi:hypothetical protein